MKNARKILSAFLAVMMSTSAVSAFSLTADAATAGGTVTVTSNVCDDVKCTYTKDSDKLTVTFDLQSDLWILNEQATLTYDTDVLKVSSTNTMKNSIPVFAESGSNVFNATSVPGEINFNSSDLSLYDFKTSDTYVTIDFDIIGGGDTTVDLDVQVLTAVDTDDRFSSHINNQVKYISGSQVVNNDFTFKASAKANSGFTSDSIYVASPILSDGMEWDDMYFAYSSNANASKVTKIPMEKTDLVYSMTGDATGVLTTNANWAIYKLTPTDAQAEAIDAASYTGFFNKKGTIRTNYVWGNAVTRANIDEEGYTGTKHTVAELKGKTFVINDSVSTGNKTSYLGYWTSKAPEKVVATIYSASPVVSSTSTMGTMYFRYGTSSTVSAANRIKMTETDYLYTAKNLSSSKLQAGEWAVYELGLTQAQADAINACNYTGFTSPYSADIRTSFTYSNSVTRANIGNAGYGSAKHTIADLNGKMFFITGSAAANTTSYTGNWGDYNAEIKTITLKVAAPTKVGKKAVNSMNLIYSEDYKAENANALKMTKTTESFKPSTTYTSLIPSSSTWAVYEVEIDANQYHALAKSRYVGFATDDVKVRTCFNYTHNIFRANVGSYSSPYDATNFTHPETLDGNTFVMCGAVNSNNTVTLNGYWQ